jgi:hypothetical protein
VLIEPIEPPNDVNKIMKETILPTRLSENLDKNLEFSIGYNGAVNIPTKGKTNIRILTLTSESCPIKNAEEIRIIAEIRHTKNIFMGANFTTALLANNLPKNKIMPKKLKIVAQKKNLPSKYVYKKLATKS